MQNRLENYLPEHSRVEIRKLLKHNHFSVVIKNERKTRHGDYRYLGKGRHQITVNSNLNPYRFLLTLVHEIAHFEAYKKFGKKIKPHGIEWKRTFQRLILPFLNPAVFPKDILPLLANYFLNPKASSDTDVELWIALKQFDKPNNKTLIFELPYGTIFKLYNGRIYKKNKKRVKRFECVEVKTGKMYIFSPNVEVEVIN